MWLVLINYQHIVYVSCTLIQAYQKVVRGFQFQVAA
jgi:hypothetical protein